MARRRKAIVGMPEKVSGVRRKDQGFCVVRGFQEGQVEPALPRRYTTARVVQMPFVLPSPAAGGSHLGNLGLIQFFTGVTSLIHNRQVMFAPLACAPRHR